MKYRYLQVLVFLPVVALLAACDEYVQKAQDTPTSWPDVAMCGIGTLSFVAVMWILFR